MNSEFILWGVYIVQAKKDKIKKLLENAALKVFSQKGYLDTKMSDIAKDANISVGNIYTYFKNKEDLFYSVVPARHVDFLRNYLVKAIHLYNKSNLSPEDEIFISEKFINVLIKYRMHLIIIFEKNKGTQYEKEKNELIQLLLEAKKPYLKSDHKYYNLCIEDNMKLMQIIISNSFNMILDLLKEEISDESRKTIFKAINVYRLYGITGLYK